MSGLHSKLALPVQSQRLLAAQAGPEVPESALLRPADAIDAAQVRRVLLIKLRHHGDVLLCSPVVTALRAVLPQAEVDAVVYQDTAAMLEGLPGLSQLHTVDRQWKNLSLWSQLSAEWRLFSALRQRQYDLIVDLTPHHRATRWVRWLRPRYSVAPQGPSRRGLSVFTHLFRVLPGNRRHTVQTHLDALRRLGLPVPTPALHLVPGAAAEQRIQTWLQEAQLRARQFIHVHPGSRWQFKCWEPQAMADTLRALLAQGWPVVLTAAPDAREAAWMQALHACLGPTPPGLHDWSGRLQLKELAALTAQARLFLGVDSVPMHIAAAMQTPVVVLFGPSGPVEWGPWQVPHRVLSLDWPCRPCGLDGCGGGKRSLCLTQLPATAVLQAVQDVLQETAGDGA